MNATFLQVCCAAALAFVHAACTRGLRPALAFAGIALGTAVVGEYAGVNVMRQVRHHSQPQLARVPLGGVLSWYAIAYGALDTAEALVARRGVPVIAALLATSLDLLLDVYGLAHGLWEWRTDGRYAREVSGPNGKRGVPLMNYAAWLVMIGGIAVAYGAVVRPRTSPLGAVVRPVRWLALPCARPGHANAHAWYVRGLGGLLLLAYYAPAAAWAARSGRVRYALFAAGVPVGVTAGLLRRLLFAPAGRQMY